MDGTSFLENLLATSGLSILMHGVISLSDATSYNNVALLLLFHVAWHRKGQWGRGHPCELNNVYALRTNIIDSDGLSS